jgi:hypothetical protein
MKDGKHMTDEFISFVKQRVSLEESYGKSLIKLSKQGCDVAEIGTLRVAWDTMRSGSTFQHVSHRPDRLQRPKRSA